MIKPQPNPLDSQSLLLGTLLGAGLMLFLAVFLMLMLVGLPPLNLAQPIQQILPTTWYQTLQSQLQAMGFPLQGDSQGFWFMARIAGILSYIFVWASVVWGLLLSTKLLKGWLSPGLSFGLHEFLSLAGLGFGLFHALILLGDQYISFGLADVLIPFAASYQPFWVGLGTLSLYFYGLLIASFYIRKRMGHKRWRKLHYLSFATYVLLVLHALVIGTDASTWLMQSVYFSTTSTVLFLTFYRILASRA
jgi:predicted ferric reductase